MIPAVLIGLMLLAQGGDQNAGVMVALHKANAAMSGAEESMDRLRHTQRVCWEVTAISLLLLVAAKGAYLLRGDKGE